MMNILGIDEAGRGCLLGPLVIAGVNIPTAEEYLLKSWGVNDSKTFGSQKKGKLLRTALAQKIKDHFSHTLFVIPSEKVDEYVRQNRLNQLEQEYASKILGSLHFQKAVLDGENLFRALVNDKVTALNKADQTHTCVGAASILAKVERDLQLETLCNPFEKEFGPVLGGGYGNQNTLNFIKWHLDRFGMLPSFYRKSYRWKALEPFLDQRECCSL